MEGFKWRGEIDGVAVTLSYQFDRERQKYICDEVVVRIIPGGPPVDSAVLSSIGVVKRLRQSLSDQLAQACPPPVVRQDGSNGPTIEMLTWLADRYRLAYAAGERPAKVLGAELGMPRSTVSRWIRVTRERGLLGPSVGQGKASP